MICLYLLLALFSCDLAQSRGVPLWYKEIESLLADDLPNDKKMVVATREGVEYTGTFSEIEDFLKSDLSKGQEMVYNHNFKREDSMEVVFGRDTRQKKDAHTFPYSAMGMIEIGCTGTFISPHVVLTAAHCVYHEGGYYTDLVFYRGRDCTPYDYYLSRHETWSHIYTYLDWRNQGNVEYDILGYDIAWIVYDKASPEYMRYTSDMPPLRSKISISGYPRYKGLDRCLWGSSDPLEDIQTRVLRYKVDTGPGQSGSAIIHDDLHTSPAIIGVNSLGSRLAGYNQGVRMTTENKQKCDEIIREHD